MNPHNIFLSNFNFNKNETHLKFKFKMLNSSMLVIVAITFIIGLLSYFGINDIGFGQMTVNFLHSFSTLTLILLLRYSKNLFNTVLAAFIITSLLNVTSALICVINDEFRIMWFFIIIYVAYMLGGTRTGLIATMVTFIIIVLSNIFFDLQLSDLAINTSLFGLVVSSLLMRAHAKKIQEFEESILAQNKELKLLSSIDHLTGLMNERIFNEVACESFQMSKEHDTKLSILSLNIDNLTQINTTYGQQVGDLLIVRFAEVIQVTLRKSDIFARVSGDKFVIFLYKTDSDETAKLAEKIREKVKSIIVSHENDFIHITTSIGVSQFRREDSTLETILERSNQALQQAKQEGKDRICYIN